MPMWRIWQTRRAQNAVGETPGRFNSCHRHVKEGTFIKHFKGGLYQVLLFTTCSKTHKQVIVYKSLDDDRLWTRPLEQFSERIVRDGYDGPRFVVID